VTLRADVGQTRSVTACNEDASAFDALPMTPDEISKSARLLFAVIQLSRHPTLAPHHEPYDADWLKIILQCKNLRTCNAKA
jgi:hypothetical protein